MQPLIEYREKFAGYETRVLELEGEGPPLVLFHGFADSADTWRLTLDSLAHADRRAVAVDLPGFATADKLTDGPVLPQLDAFGRAVVKHYAPEGGALAAGNSLGGCLSLRIAEDPALGLAGIVPVAPAGLDMARWMQIIEREPLVRLVLASPLPIPPNILHPIIGRVYRTVAFARPGAVDGKVVSAFASHFADQATTARFLATGRRMYPELRDPFRLDRIECPVLIVWGVKDRMVYSGGAQRVVDALPDTQVELIEGCGHCPQIEAPERFAELLLDFPSALSQAA